MVVAVKAIGCPPVKTLKLLALRRYNILEATNEPGVKNDLSPTAPP
jgi:hypothetical protein